MTEIPENVKRGLAIHPVKWFDQVLGFALERQPEPLVMQEKITESVIGVTDVEPTQHPVKH